MVCVPFVSKAGGTHAADDPIEQDRRDLRQGVSINTLGYLLKLSVPIMMVFVVRSYGVRAFGLFVLTQAVLLFVARVCIVGLDKALLWWIPRQPKGCELNGWSSSIVSVGVLSAMTAIGMTAFTRPVATWLGGATEVATPLRIMAAALVPMTLLEMLLAACMGRKRMEPNVLIKDTVLPIATVGFALLLVPLRLGSTGLGLAFLAAYVCACALAWAWWRQLFHDAKDPSPHRLLPPDSMLQYAFPMWLSEMSNAFLLRMDTYAVTTLGDLQLVGIYGSVTTMANTIRQIRRSFDPIVFVITAEIGAQAASERLREGFSYATYLVTATQLPVLAFMVAFAKWLMPLFGDGFDAGTTAVIILCVFWVTNSALSLAGIVVSAYGHARVAFFNVLFVIVVEGIALWFLVPLYGIDGAAVAVGIAYSLQGIAQVVQMRLLTGSWNYTRRVAWPLGIGSLAAGFAGLVWMIVPDPHALIWRATAFAVFVLVYGAGMIVVTVRYEPRPTRVRASLGNPR